VASSADTGTYLLIVAIGVVLTVAVGQILMRTGLGFLRDVFDDRDVAQSITRLLGVGFYLVALGILALFSTVDLIPVANTVQLVVTKVGAMLLFLGILHVITLYVLTRVRNNSRVQRMANQLRSPRRPQPDPTDHRVIESGSS
jgi:uncharacterized membrane protein HdeD (DUF308 family)